jgi:predicted transcriptional regulator|tara:strand:+ start:463 stop:675 length:213 start_codon:yes stop_codon:yes gene_type:complete
MERHFKNLREEMRYFGVRIQSVAESLKYTQPYVSQVLCGKRQNPKILAKAMELLNERKRDLATKLEGTYA